jgi:8-oxo-dGTP pyrophosphatase MutT (NUDIX family)
MQKYFPKNEQEEKDFERIFQVKKGEPLVPYFEADNIDALPKPNTPTICLKAVSSIIKHYSENEYLVVKHHRSGVSGYLSVSGGMEEGERPEETAVREITEETGYKNLKFIKSLGDPIYFKYFKASKNQNRLLQLIPLYFETIDDEVEKMTEYEKAKQEPVWLMEKDIEKFLSTRPFHRIFWERMKSI